MKCCLIILAFALMFFRCSIKEKQNSIDYIKVLTFCRPDTVTAYNKGLGIENYAYYEPAKDSFVYKELINIDTIQHKTYTAKLGGTHFDDSLFSLIKALSKYKSGIIQDTSRSGAGSTYCGPAFYVEYKKNDQVHYNQFILDGDKAFNAFSNFFFRIGFSSLKLQMADNSLINNEHEAVAAMIISGEYEKMEAPYIPKSCGIEIDGTKIYGSWRLVLNGFNYKNNFRKLTFTPEGTCFFERVKDGIAQERKHINSFYINKKTNILTVKTEENVFKFPLLKLTDSCLVMKDHNYEVRYDRL